MNTVIAVLVRQGNFLKYCQSASPPIVLKRASPLLLRAPVVRLGLPSRRTG